MRKKGGSLVGRFTGWSSIGTSPAEPRIRKDLKTAQGNSQKRRNKKPTLPKLKCLEDPPN